MVQTTTPVGKRPNICGSPKPLTQDDPIEWWAEAAAPLGLTADALKEQVRLADEILEEMVLEEDVERAEARGILARSES